MASSQDCKTAPGPRVVLRSGNSDAMPYRRGVCETLRETPEEEEEKEVSSSPRGYVQQLQSVLGRETAEYFLNPPPMDFQVSPSLQKILDETEDALGAEELWRVLQERSKQKLKEVYGELTRPDTINLIRDFAQRPAMQKVSRKRKNLIHIRQVLESQQSLTHMLLSDNPLPDVSNCQGLEGPSRYLPQEREQNLNQ